MTYERPEVRAASKLPACRRQPRIPETIAIQSKDTV
jgi:hypothetical protein